MSQILSRMEKQAVMLGQAPHEYRERRILHARETLADVIDLAGIEGGAQKWNRIDQSMRRDPDNAYFNLVGGIQGPELTPSIVNQPTITGSATEQLLWGGAANTPMQSNLITPKIYRLFAAGTGFTAAAAGTFTLTPRIGTLITSPILGAASAAITPANSLATHQWAIEGWILVRTNGATGVATGSLHFEMTSTSGGAGPASVNARLGGISASVDFTAAQALVVGAIHATSTTNTWIPQSVIWLSSN